jgi:predicted transcriptional regulator
MTLTNLKLDKWTEILPLIEENNTTSKIVKEYGMTSSHTIGIIRYFEKYKLLKMTKVGREKKLVLTQKGKDTVKLLQQLKNNIQ